jgi:D-3-phosphoglycerate dehydrogenase / 2-oxoglutarate reductase
MSAIFLTHPKTVLGTYYTEEAVDGLRKLGEVRLNEKDRSLSTAELIEAARGCEIVITNPQMPGEAALFENAPDMVAFVRCAVDLRTVAVDAASAAGILVTHVKPAFVPSVTELILGFMIDLGRTVSRSVIDYRAQRTPAVTIGRQLFGSTLGIIGYGAIGRYLCEVGAALGMNVLVNDPFVDFTRPGIRQVDFTTLLQESDFVVCLALATDETENLMNADAFAHMKKTAYFINASRGALVDEGALERALNEGHIAGAALDVGRQPGNLPSPHLAGRNDVIATPHLGGRTPPSVEHPATETVTQAAEILKGQIPQGAVNPESASRLAAWQRTKHT